MKIESLARPEILGPALVRVTGDARWNQCTAELIAGGRSNLTFALTSGAGELVLRRPPSGALLPSAHDMNREARVQQALAGSSVPVPRIVFNDTAGDLLGVPCYVMSKVPGHVLRTPMPKGYAHTNAERHAIADALVDTLLALHRIDPAAVGLADFGRPEGFLERQLKRWTGQWEKSATHPVAEVSDLGAALTEARPQVSRASIVHGDYRLDNCILDLDDPARIGAVLDWELSSLGDPLTDLGMLLFYWRERSDPEISILPAVTPLPGFPPRSHLAQRYAEAAEVSLAEIDYYVAFAHFKFAVIVQGVAARVAAGAMAGQDFGNLDSIVRESARGGLQTLDKRG